MTTHTWERPPNEYHAHFDCFSGAAGDMLLAACLDASESPNDLLNHVAGSIAKGLPELANDFELKVERVWRGGMGSIAALHVKVLSRFNHAPAPVPKPSAAESKDPTMEARPHDNSASPTESHSHRDHHGHSQEHSHESASADHETGALHTHDHVHQHSHDQSSSHSHDHSHVANGQGPLRNLPEIRRMVESAPEEHIAPWVREMAIATFTELAKAEAKTHGADGMDSVHFHEVGAVDSIVDTVGTLLALHALGVSTVTCSRLPLGEGNVWTDHGLLPVPAPATLRLMVGMPTCPGPPGITGELVTPTGAALLRTLTLVRPSNRGMGNQVSTMEGRPPNMTIRRIGVGAGTKEFEKHPNIVRLLLGDCVTSKTK